MWIASLLFAVAACRSPVDPPASQDTAVSVGSNDSADDTDDSGTPSDTGTPLPANGVWLPQIADGVFEAEGAGSSVAAAGDVDGDGLADVRIGGWVQGCVDICAEPSYVWLVSGPAVGHTAATATFGPHYDDGLVGHVPGPRTDLDGDGLDDLIITGRLHAEHGNIVGPPAHWLAAFRGPVTGSVDKVHADFAVWFDEVAPTGGAWAADLDSDGHVDLVTTVGGGPGAWIFRGPLASGNASPSPSTRLAGSVGGVDASTDFNGNGTRDLVLGLPANEIAGPDAGALVFVDGATEAEADAHDAAFARIYGAPGLQLGTGPWTGTNLITIGVLGDEFTIAWGKQTEDDRAGTVRVFQGPFDGDQSADDAIAIIRGEVPPPVGEQLGHSLASGDFNGDGVSDLLVGTGSYTGNRALLFLGQNLQGELTHEDATVVFYGEGSHDDVGRSVANVGDLNGDGFDDIAIGAPGKGAVYFVYGRSSW